MTFWARHGAHVIVLGGPFLLLLGMGVALRLKDPERPRVARETTTSLLAVSWLASAAVHLLVVREHFAEATLLGVFFVMLAVVQILYVVVLLLAPSRPLVALGLATNAGVIALWTYTRTVAVPFGLGPREAVGAADLTATAFEVMAVVLAAGVLRRRSPGLGTTRTGSRTRAREDQCSPIWT